MSRTKASGAIYADCKREALKELGAGQPDGLWPDEVRFRNAEHGFDVRIRHTDKWYVKVISWVDINTSSMRCIPYHVRQMREALARADIKGDKDV